VGLSKANRLKDRRDFQTVYHRGIRCNSPHLILRGLVVQNNDNYSNLLVQTRIGISIGKKVSKKAVIRNRIKRQIRAVLRELLPKITDIWQIVIVVKVGATECKYEHFLRELKQLFKKAEAIDGN
jgi:ribonuclease P protein component